MEKPLSFGQKFVLMRLRKIFLWFLILLLTAAGVFFGNRYWQGMRPVKIPEGFDWQGHRGCRGLMPENTVAAFLKALEFSQIKTLELDLAVSKDGRLIVSHEPWFNHNICRTAQGAELSAEDEKRLLIHQLSLSEIRQFDCGNWGNPKFPRQQRIPEYKPTLSNVVAAVQQHFSNRFSSIFWNIEIKSRPDWDGSLTPPVAEFAQLVVAELDSLGIRDQCYIQSFDPRALQQVHALNPTIKTVLLVENTEGLSANLKKLGFTPSVYSPYHLLVSASLAKQCHAAGIKLVPWTVNEVSAMRRLIRAGVDGIITDYPDLIDQVAQ